MANANLSIREVLELIKKQNKKRTNYLTNLA